MLSPTTRNLRLHRQRMMPGIVRSYALSLHAPRPPHISYQPPLPPTVSPKANTTSKKTRGVPLTPNLKEVEFWRGLAPFRTTSRDEFLSWNWNRTLEASGDRKNLLEFLDNVVPDEVPRLTGISGMQTRDEFCTDVVDGIKRSSMSVRVMPFVLSRINWSDPANCPIFRQFIPLNSIMIDNHPEAKYDSLHEKQDSPVSAIVHRYPDKALFLPTHICPTYCIFCTRSYGVGPITEALTKKEDLKATRTRIQEGFDYIRSQDQLRDIVVSGGDAYYLPPHILEWIGDELIGMKNIQRFRIATKGLAVCPNRILDETDPWTETLLRISDKARKANKHFAVHTHFNHPNEITWLTGKACQKLHQAGVTVRNQSVLLRGVNDDVDTMSSLIQKLASMNVQPYYVYQCDMVKKVEHLRTPLQTILDLESQIRGTIAGFFMPQFVVDCPGGGGKRLACSYDSYNRETGVSTFRAPALTKNGKKGKVYKYYDPLPVKSSPKRPLPLARRW